MHWNGRGFLLIDSSIPDYLTNRERAGLLSLAPGTSCDLYLSWLSRVNFCLWHWRVWTTQFGTVSGTYHHDRPSDSSKPPTPTMPTNPFFQAFSNPSHQFFHASKAWQETSWYTNSFRGNQKGALPDIWDPFSFLSSLHFQITQSLWPCLQVSGFRWRMFVPAIKSKW